MTNSCPYERRIFGSNKDDRTSLSILKALGFWHFKNCTIIPEHRYRRRFLINLRKVFFSNFHLAQTMIRFTEHLYISTCKVYLEALPFT